jgi:hypothetical protein
MNTFFIKKFQPAPAVRHHYRGNPLFWGVFVTIEDGSTYYLYDTNTYAEAKRVLVNYQEGGTAVIRRYLTYKVIGKTLTLGDKYELI